MAAVALTLKLLQNPETGRILICATSNVTVEHLVEALFQPMKDSGKNLVHLAANVYDQKPMPGQKKELEALCYQKIWESNYKEAEEWQELELGVKRRDSKKLRKELRKSLDRQICSEADVIVCTLIMSGAASLKQLRFNTVIIDEATQALEASSLIPMMHGATRFVIVGDQNQLGPTVSEETLSKVEGYNISLFERMIENNFPFSILDTQFRMHPAISAFPSKQFYNGQIKDGITAEDRTCETLPFFPSESKPIAFYDIDGEEESPAGDLSYFNLKEADAVAKIAHIMTKNGIADRRIGVICPYSAQLSLIRKKIN
jgi:regulator of nonsense transcripts 1